MRIAVFASGGGTNLQALLDHFNVTTDRGGRVMLAISDRSSAAALRRAANAGVMARAIPVSGRSDHEVALELLEVLADERIDIIALAGYLRLIPTPVIEKFRNRIVNIHPALLPAFGGPGMYGRHVHQAVLDAGCMVTGATVHYVDEHYDEGGTIAQWPVPVLPNDSVDDLAARVLRVEHMLFPLALEAIIRRMNGGDPGGNGAALSSGDDLVFSLHPRDTVDAPVMQHLITQ